MLSPIKLLSKKAELVGTCYFEFAPGKFSGACWSEGSVFIEDEVFSLIEVAFVKAAPNFDRYMFNDVDKTQWLIIVSELSQIQNQLSNMKTPNTLSDVLQYVSNDTLNKFEANFEVNRKDLIELIASFSSWIKEQLISHDYIAVLGM